MHILCRVLVFEIVWRGPRWPWTHETERRTTKHQSVLTVAHPQPFSFAVPSSTLCLLATAGLKHARLSIHHLRDGSFSQSHTHVLSFSLSPSLVLSL